jgi:sugar phosphate isomerase/epimerase
MRYAICNETFEGWDHARVCRLVSDLGYAGLELAPFTLAPRITDVTPEQRRLLRRQADDCGLTLLGLHWLLARTEGLHLTAADVATRQRTADYLAELARCCRDLGGDVLVFGSPAQRRVPPGVSRKQAMDHAADTFRRALPVIADCGVKLCLEPLTPQETDFMNTCAQGAELLDRLNHPNVLLHLDPNKRGPGFGDVDFAPIFQALRKHRYQGWVSVEVFDYSPDPETIARESLRYMRECEEKAKGIGQ